jgi:hypothetical protein
MANIISHTDYIRFISGIWINIKLVPTNPKWVRNKFLSRVLRHKLFPVPKGKHTCLPTPFLGGDTLASNF